MNICKYMKPDKSKLVSIVLAVFLSFWTFLYTYKLDKYLFWAGLGMTLFGLLLGYLLGYVIVLSVWIASIYETIRRDSKTLVKYW